jgi:hypothetical protein
VGTHVQCLVQLDLFDCEQSGMLGSAAELQERARTTETALTTSDVHDGLKSDMALGDLNERSRQIG